jgi:hypothetical protein
MLKDKKKKKTEKYSYPTRVNMSNSWLRSWDWDIQYKANRKNYKI